MLQAHWANHTQLIQSPTPHVAQRRLGFTESRSFWISDPLARAAASVSSSLCSLSLSAGTGCRVAAGQSLSAFLTLAAATTGRAAPPFAGPSSRASPGLRRALRRPRASGRYPRTLPSLPAARDRTPRTLAYAICVRI
ncbi:hypothetical protein PVAP13_4NG183455 [Panicum virgatum]|uniref:Uncharacterized protein n=1 Tax=Panicum virgatum TaxID=38727 RepID=A0A8T0TF18_PANVG|nr:hypothetical protein PVAP13_4NG183455 [Panicum virgatum]